MKRKIHMNEGTNVQMYATESSGSSNTNNCASGCAQCSNDYIPPPTEGGGHEVLGHVISLVIGIGTA